MNALNNLKNSRKGFVIFIVLAAIFVLSILVMSYNFFVRGKFNESREILKHLRATKCAQSLSKYVFSCLENDLRNITDEASIGNKLRLKVFCNNDPSSLKEALEKEWFNNILKNKCKDFVNSILVDTIGSDSPGFEVEFGFSNIHLLKDLKASKGLPDELLFFDYEKVGKMTLRVTVTIGRSREVWQETRPFKVVFPFPIPITKFNFYWNDGVADSENDKYGFNRVSLNGDNGRSNNGNNPFIFDNGSIEENGNAEVWKQRGWIYMGGNYYLYLNRAGGDKEFGQNHYSYPRDKYDGKPPTLMLDFPSGDGLSEYKVKNEELGFRVACWGFTEALTNSSTNAAWKDILKYEYKNNPESKKLRWQSSCLHIFSHIDLMRKENLNQSSNSDKSSNVTPTITRVVGNVCDRYLELGYLLPKSSSNVFLAAVTNLSEEAFKSAQSSGGDNDGFSTDYTFDKYLYFPHGYQQQLTELEDLNTLQSYFDNFVINKYKSDTNAFSFHEVMSKVRIQGFDDTYDVVSQYSAGSNDINLPPSQSVPRISEKQFWPSNYTQADEKSGVLKYDFIKQMSIDKIGKIEDKTFGLSLRKCYEIDGTSEIIKDILNSEFGSSEDGFGWNLNNLVIEVVSNDLSNPIDIGRDFKLKTPGTIYRKEGPLRIGEFSQDLDSLKAPLLLLTGKGNITVDNVGNNEVRAYLVALGDGGTVKASNANAALRIRGGMAVKEFKPDNIPSAGGYLTYNTELDPIKDSFFKYIGIAFGPKGGKL